MSLKQAAVRGAKWTSGAMVFTTVLHTAQLVVLGWILESDDFGLMAMAMILIGLGQACSDLGSGALVQREATREQRSSLFWINAWVGASTGALVALATPIAALGFGDPRVSAVLWALCPAFAILPLGRPFEALLQREMRFGVLAAQEVLAGCSGFLAAMIVALRGGGVWSLVAAFLASSLVRTGFVLAVALPHYPIQWRCRPGEVRPFLSFGAFQVGERAVGFLAQRLDQVLIGAVLGTGVLGYYSYAFNIVATPMARLNQVIAKVTYPLFARVQHEPEKLRSGFLRVLGLMMAIDGPLLVGIAVTAPVAVPLVLGDKWLDSVPYVAALSFVVLAKCPGPVVGSLLLSVGKAHRSFAMNAMILVASAPAIWIGGQLGGGVGIALALFVVQVLVKIPTYRWMVRPVLGPCAEEFARALLTPFLLALAMGAGVAVLAGWLPGLPPALDLAVQIGAGVVGYVLLFVALDRGRARELVSLLVPPAPGRRNPLPR